MTATPVITVLMPVYNAEEFLAEAIDSILQQTFTRFELLIIDDGSTDASVAIVHSYSDPRIRFIKNERNLGISATLNRGIDLSTTELIARMDADDISYPERLQRQYDYFQHHADCALLSTAARVISSGKTPIRIDQFKSEYFYYNLNFICWIYHPTVMYKRSAVIEVGKYNVPYSEDFDLWWQLSRKYAIAHLEEVLLDYRVSDKSLSHFTKRTEYETAQQEQVLRNIHYYTGSSYSITDDEIACYRHNFDPLLKRESVSAIIKSIKKLDYINICIFKAKNINYNDTALVEAAYHKKQYIINFFFTHLPKLKAIQLALLTTPLRNLSTRLINILFKNIYRNEGN